MPRQWWRQAVVYQVYPRSFADGNGDGVGDFKGLISRIPYLRDLGVDAVWLSPFYPSGLRDGGYDVADYRNVDPKIGTLAEFDEMSNHMSAAGIRLIIDIVPNHSSTDHPWFKAAIAAGRGSRERERYIFRDGLGPEGRLPPTDWQCHFGGPWSPSGLDDGQWYFHIFDSSQPDFNWDCPDVQNDFLQTFRFWADRGVSGFRIDVAHHLTKDLREPLPTWEDLSCLTAQKLRNNHKHLRHPLLDREETLAIFRSWRQLFDCYDPPLIGVAECWVAPDQKSRYAAADGLGQAFSFDMLLCNFDAHEYRQCIEETLRGTEANGSSATWVLSNHDVVRHATRFAMPAIQGNERNELRLAEACNSWLFGGLKDPAPDVERGLLRARAAFTFLLALPGSTYLYQGEELGLPEVVNIPPSARQDPRFRLSRGKNVGRDGCRVPLPWDSNAKHFGFGSGSEPHLPMPAWMRNYAIDVQAANEDSMLNLYRRALALRRRLQTDEMLSWGPTPSASSLHVIRSNGWHALINMGDEPLPLPARGEILLSSASITIPTEVPRESTLWWRETC